MNKNSIAILLVAIVIAGGFYFYKSNSSCDYSSKGDVVKSGDCCAPGAEHDKKKTVSSVTEAQSQ